MTKTTPKFAAEDPKMPHKSPKCMTGIGLPRKAFCTFPYVPVRTRTIPYDLVRCRTISYDLVHLSAHAYTLQQTRTPKRVLVRKLGAVGRFPAARCVRRRIIGMAGRVEGRSSPPVGRREESPSTTEPRWWVTPTVPRGPLVGPVGIGIVPQKTYRPSRGKGEKVR